MSIVRTARAYICNKEEGESLGTGREDSGVGVGQTPPGYHDAHTFPKDEE